MNIYFIKPKSTTLCCIIVLFAGNCFGDDKVPAEILKTIASQMLQINIPAKAVLSGKTFSFDQEQLESNLQGDLDIMAKAINAAADKKANKDDVDTNNYRVHAGMRSIAYSVIAVGELGKMTDSLAADLGRIVSMLGVQKVPTGISWPEDQVKALMSVSFSEEKSRNPMDYETEESKKTFGELVDEAKIRIEIRNGVQRK